ncbi:MAG: helix-turn-helix transcriptional regulator, partial [Burkholderiaceae bacterium]|nr:helix-turn-helix transcriptional regulator [Burkholderiaceae bacterium]
RPFGPAQRLLMEQLLPDLRRVVRLRTRLAPLNEELAKTSTALQALHALPHAVMLVDTQGLIHYANPAAERVLHSDAPLPSALKSDTAPEGLSWLLRSHHGKLECGSPQAQASLESLVRAACADSLSRPRSHQSGSVWLGPRAAGRQPGLAVNVLRLPQDGWGNAATGRKPLALLLITSPQLPAEASQTAEDTVRATLNLTPAETRLALGLARGLTLKDIAAQEDISWHTARTHLKNLLQKTSFHRQIDLVQFLRPLLGG